MAGSVNKVAVMYRDEFKSIPMIADSLGLPRSRVRSMLLSSGVPLRSRAEGVRLRAAYIGELHRGTKRQMTQEWKDNIRAARQRHGDATAKGLSLKSSGYIQITKGPNKHRSQHVVIMEQRLGRRLLPDECVHHIDGNRSNNRHDNLALVTRAGHSRLHRRERRMQKDKTT